MDKEICTICLGDGVLDDDYTFYNSGKIKRFYDRNSFKFNIEEWIDAKNIPASKKAEILEKCEMGFREIIEQKLK
jgi:hypothetical protein